MDGSEFAKRIGGLLRAARENGDLEPLSHYQRRFKGFESLVAREHAIVEREARGPVSSGGIVRDWVPPQDRGSYTHRGEIARGGMGAILRVRVQGLNRDSEGWRLAVRSGDRTRVAVTRRMGYLLLLDPKRTTANVRSLTARRELGPSLAARHALLGFSGLALDEIGDGLDAARREEVRVPLRAMDTPDRLNAGA